MALKTFNPAATGDLWSTAAAWGGSLPVNGDSFVIAPGKTCYMDTDLSAMSSGMIAGAVSGVLTGPLTTGSGYLKFNGGAAQDLTIGATGQLIFGTSESSPAATGIRFTIDLGALSEIRIVAGAQIKLHPTLPTTRYVQLTTAIASGATALQLSVAASSLQNDYWRVGDYLAICGQTTNTTLYKSLTSISSFGTGYQVNIASGASSGYNASAYVINLSSNMMIIGNRTSNSEYMFETNYISAKIGRAHV